MKIQTIANKVKKSTGAGYILRGATAGTVFAEFCADDWDKYSEICAKAWRMKGVYVENHLMTRVIRLWTAEDWKAFNDFEDEKKNLVNGFWEALHNFGRAAADAYYIEHKADYVRLGIV